MLLRNIVIQLTQIQLRNERANTFCMASYYRGHMDINIVISFEEYKTTYINSESNMNRVNTSGRTKKHSKCWFTGS